MSKRRKHVELGTPIDLDMSARYFTFNRQYAVKDVIDGLVELITNSDDSYHRLYRAGQRTEDGGPILIQLFAQRGGKTSELQVRDRAEGMALQEMVAKLGTIGERASENGDRGFMARGARDCTELGEMYIESIKGDRYYACRLTTNAQLIPEADGNLVDNVTRQRLGIRQRENGTVITVTVAPHHHMPRLSSLVRDLPWHFALRHILAEDSDTRVMVTNANRPDDDPQCIVYRCPEGELVVDTEYEVAGYDGATAHLKVWRAPEPFESSSDRRLRKSGLLVKGVRAIHQCDLLAPEFENDPLAARYFGQIECAHIDTLLAEYDKCQTEGDSVPERNPNLLIDPHRQTGLRADHPFTKALFQIPTERLRALIARDREATRSQSREIANAETKQRLKKLAQLAGRFMQEQIEDLEEIGAGDEVDPDAFHDQGVVVIPTYVRLAVGEEKKLWMYASRELTSAESVRVTAKADSEALEVLDQQFRLTPHQRKEDRLVGTFRVRAKNVSDGVYVGVTGESLPVTGAYVEITETRIEYRDFAYPLEFEHVQNSVRLNAKRALHLFALYPDLVSVPTEVTVSASDDSAVVIRGRSQLVGHLSRS